MLRYPQGISAPRRIGLQRSTLQQCISHRRWTGHGLYACPSLFAAQALANSSSCQARRQIRASAAAAEVSSDAVEALGKGGPGALYADGSVEKVRSQCPPCQAPHECTVLARNCMPCCSQASPLALLGLDGAGIYILCASAFAAWLRLCARCGVLCWDDFILWLRALHTSGATGPSNCQ